MTSPLSSADIDALLLCFTAALIFLALFSVLRTRPHHPLDIGVKPMVESKDPAPYAPGPYVSDVSDVSDATHTAHNSEVQ